MNSVAYLLQSKRLLEQVREMLRYKHYSLKTEQAYLYWVRFFVRWHGRDGQMQHPRSMGGAEVTQFLTMLANERSVSVSTHNQALSALMFLYRQVRAVWMHDREVGCAGVEVPDALVVKYPDLGRRWGWFWVSPQLNSRLTHAPGSNVGTTSMKNACSAPSSWPVLRRKLSNRCPEAITIWT